ncbi:AP endonuclease [Streptomyces sp. HK10]|uniref:AP endonuclease n=1 Tax=Streptomyces sp. HK10 TaxID=3373255 RepID=UPI00374A6EB3
MSTPVGLYSIGVRGLRVPELLQWAGSESIPFVHLRGGPRGCDLTGQPRQTLHHWRHLARQAGVPVTGVTGDIDVGEVFAPSRTVRERARAELERLADAAAVLGAGWVRLLGRTVPRPPLPQEDMPAPAVPVLVELHHPAWLTPAALETLHILLERRPRLRLLADIVQLAAALPSAGSQADAALERVLDATGVLHLSDDGAGLARPGRERVAALAAARIARGQDIEVAVEWTGQPRTPAACLARYQAARAWWAERTASPLNRT